MNKKWTTVVFLIVLFSTSAAAQELEVIKVDTSLVAVNVSVTDQKKRCVLDLTVENFEVTDQGRPVKIEFFDNKGPASIVFVIDTSASMYQNKWDYLKSGLKRFLDDAREGNDYTLILFDDYPRFVAESVTQKELWEHLKKSEQKGNTALYDALLMGLEVIGRQQRRQKALVLLSDGQDTRSRAQLIDVQREAMVERATIYAVGILPRVGYLSEKELDGKEILSQMAHATGGLASFPKPSDVSKALTQIQTDINSQYTLSYYASDKTPGWRNVQVTIPSVSKPLILRYQKRYFMKDEVQYKSEQQERNKALLNP